MKISNYVVPIFCLGPNLALQNIALRTMRYFAGLASTDYIPILLIVGSQNGGVLRLHL